MEIPSGTASLLFTLLEEVALAPDKYGIVDPIARQSITEVVEATRPPPPSRPSLIKNVAQRKLYEVLYHVIEKEYEEPQHEPETEAGRVRAEAERELNRKLNSAIGRALESAISGEFKGVGTFQTLRDELRKQIIEALTPK